MDRITESVKDTQDADRQYDNSVKSLGSYKWVAAHILKGALPACRNMSIEEIMGRIVGNILVNRSGEPGFTNTGSDNPDEKIRGINTEDYADNEGLIRYDLLFYFRLGDGDDDTLYGIIVNIEFQRNLAWQYELGDRKQVYVARALGSQKEREFRKSRFSDAKEVFDIWIVFGRDANSLAYGRFEEKSVPGYKDDPELLASRSLMNTVTIGLTNELPEDKDGKLRLHRFLTAMFGTNVPLDERLAVLNDEYGLKEAGQHAELREEIETMGGLGAALRREAYREGYKEAVEEAAKENARLKKVYDAELEAQKREAREELEAQKREAREELEAQKREDREKLEAQKREARVELEAQRRKIEELEKLLAEKGIH